MERLEIKRINDKLLYLAEKHERKIEFNVSCQRDGYKIDIYDATHFRENPDRYSIEYICGACTYEFADKNIEEYFGKFKPKEMTFAEVEAKLGHEIRLVVDMETVSKLKLSDNMTIVAEREQPRRCF